MLCLKSLKTLPFFGALSVLASSSSCVVMCSVSPELNVCAAGRHEILGLLKDVDLFEGPTCKC